MAHETDDPRDVADDVQYAPQSIQDSLTTKLTPAEQRLGATSRKVAFCVLAASILPAQTSAAPSIFLRTPAWSPAALMAHIWA